MAAKMSLISIALFASWASKGLAQQLLPAELSSDFLVENALVSNFSGVVLTEPGQLVATADTKSAPTVGIKNGILGSVPYLFLMVDPSYNASVPTNVVLHTMVANVTSPDTGASIQQIVSASTPAIAPYIGPQPQAGKPSHNYTLLLFTQPEGFAIPAAFDSFLPLNLSNVYTRTNFPLLDFVKESNLGGELIAANWFRLNLTSGAGVSTPTGSNIPVKTSSVAVSGAAHRIGIPSIGKALLTAVVVLVFNQLTI